MGFNADELKFGAPFIDIDEWRDVPRRHRYVHGGFEDTDTRFSFYLPPPELYKGRFVQILEGGAGGNETSLITGSFEQGVGFSYFDMAFEDLGAYLVESNQGHFPGGGLGLNSAVDRYGASAESARYSRVIAERMYGAAPHHGYIGGASGGGSRTITCLEEASDIYDGAVPMVTAVMAAVEWTVFPWACLVLGDKVKQVIDATEPGGSGNPFEGLDTEQREALRDLYRSGWPRGAESQLYPLKTLVVTLLSMASQDPEYFQDFWTQSGFRGHDALDRLAPYLIELDATVTEITTAGERAANANPVVARRMARTAPDKVVGIRIGTSDVARLFMCKLRVETGAAAGRELWINDVDDGMLMPFSETAPEMFDGVKPGDKIKLSNRDWLAFCHMGRHSVRSRVDGTLIPEYRAWHVDGNAIYPQREPTKARSPTNEIPGKMISVQATHDSYIWPTQLMPYVRALQDRHGDALSQKFRIWWVEHATHGPPGAMIPWNNPIKSPAYWDTRLVGYRSVTQQAFRDLARWVEEGVPPPSSTNYRFNDDNRLILAADASERGGIQPVVHATANGKARAEVAVGEKVRLEGKAKVPPGTGTLVAAEWEFENNATWPTRHKEADGSKTELTVRTEHSFDKPGTYFVAFRAGSARNGAAGPGDPIYNIARVRVVVS